MYLRTVQRKNKDGSTVKYLQLAHNQRHPETGLSQAQILWSFGREDELDVDALQRLIRSVQRYLGPKAELKGAAAASSIPGELNFVSSRPFGGGHFLDSLWRRLELDQVIGQFVEDREFKFSVERAIFSMVANRALAPCSKLATQEWVAEDAAVPGVDEIDVQHLYRAMDVLVECDREIQKAVYFKVSDLFNLEVDLIFLDTTSSYFEVSHEDDDEDAEQYLRQRGHSKDSRPDLAQIVIGLAVTREGIPIRCWVWPGNKVDVSVVAEVKRDLVGWKLGQVITVADRGFMSEENLRTLKGNYGDYIVAEKMRGKKPNVEAILADTTGRYKTVRDNIKVKEYWMPTEGEEKERYVLVLNPEKAEYEKARRNDILLSLQAELVKLGKKKNAKESKDLHRLMAHRAYSRFLKLGEQGLPIVDEDKVAAEARLDGKYILRCSNDELSAADVALGYRQLLEVEAAFRTLKTTLEMRPIYHRLSRRISAHVTLCWLALLLVRVAEVEIRKATKTSYSWDTIRAELSRLHVGEFKGKAGTVHQTTELRPLQRQFYNALNVKLPNRFVSLGLTSA